MMPILQVGPLAIQLPGLLLLLGVWLGTLTLDRQAERRGLSADPLSKLVFYALLVGLAGARLGYAFRHLPAYLDDPLSLIALQPQTLSAFDGAAAALIFGWAYARRAGLPLWRTLDALAPMAAIVAVFLGSGEHLPAETDLARRQVFPGPFRCGAKTVIRARSTRPWRRLRSWPRLSAGVRRDLPEGVPSLAFLALTALARLFLETFRGDSLVVMGGTRAAQLVSLALLLAALEGLRARWIRTTSPVR